MLGTNSIFHKAENVDCSSYVKGLETKLANMEKLFGLVRHFPLDSVTS